MHKDPAFMFYSSDFLTGIIFLSMAERGQYITTLCLLHQHGGYLPLAKIETVTGQLSTTLLEKFKLNDKRELYNERLLKEIEKRVAFCESRRLSAKQRYVRSAYADSTQLRMGNEDGNGNIAATVQHSSVFAPPTVEAVKAYCVERRNSIDAEAFVNFYESKGWMIGKNKMKSWQAAIRTWERSSKPTQEPRKERNWLNDQP